MPDNVQVTSGSGTSVRTDDVGGVHYQVVKIDVGADGVSTPLSETNALPVGLSADARTSKLTSGVWTLASGVVESITIPSWARGFRLRPTADIRFAISEDPVAAGTETLTVGNIAYANESEVRLIETGAVTVRLLATGASTVTVEFY